MPMQPRPIAPTVGPCFPSLRVFMRATLAREWLADKSAGGRAEHALPHRIALGVEPEHPHVGLAGALGRGADEDKAAVARGREAGDELAAGVGALPADLAAR